MADDEHPEMELDPELLQEADVGVAGHLLAVGRKRDAVRKRRVCRAALAT